MAKIAVIGAGVFGGWSALELQRRGHDVTLIDCWGPGNSRASSGGETRVMRSVYADPLYVRMAQRALQLWQDNQRQFGQTLFLQQGALFMAQHEGLSFLQQAEGYLRDAGVGFESLAPAELSQRYPQMGLEGVEQAIYEPDAGMLLARQSCAAVLEAFLQIGGQYLNQQARPGEFRGGRLHNLNLADASRLAADQFVFACGPWLPVLFPQVLGQHASVTRQEVFYFGTPPQDRRFEAGQLPIWADFGDRIWYGLPGNERRGFKICDDTRGPAFDPDSDDRMVSRHGVEAARAYLRRRFPDMAEAALVESRVCQYTVSPDEHFLMDRHPEADNAWLLGCGSGHGFKHGPVIGEMMAECIAQQRAVEPRFSCR